ncbi:MAG: [CysO sulfur-carrier protein]-S-L-cysteine hydrolase [Solirubrobacterales bacterium]|nr:[CysO sulfur-carrier protein]-S-L-cysteine hydrolase [Solirubrobacterales bacterium]
MRIAQALIDEIVAHAREDAPNECCGLIGGRDGTATSIHRAENLFASPTRFEVANPVKLLSAIEGAGEDLAGIYHSHTKSEAYPSQTDVNLARGWPDPLWFICSLADADAPVVRAFAIRDGEVDEVVLEAG